MIVRLTIGVGLSPLGTIRIFEVYMSVVVPLSSGDDVQIS